MGRRAALILGISLALGAVLLIVFEKTPSEAATPADASAAPAAASAPSKEAAPTPTAASVIPARPATNTKFDKLDDGNAVPALAEDAPQQVKLGVALFAYDGAQGVPPGSRSRDAALELARAALQAGTAEFAKALEKADRGSRDDVGWVRRGILEKRVEYEVFRLEKGTLASEPIDTPRGFWVVRRLQ